MAESAPHRPGTLTHLNLARGYRGGERQTELLLRGLSALGWSQRLVARRGEPLAARCRDIPGLAISTPGGGVPAAALALRGAGLVHSHEGRGVQAAWLLHRFGGAPYVVTRRVEKGPGQTPFNRAMYRDAARVVAISVAIRNKLQAFEPRLSPLVIPSAAAGLAPEAATAAGLRRNFGGDFIVGHVGALDDSHKGQRQIIALARRLAVRQPGIRFVLVGSGRDDAALRAAAAGLGNVVFTGQVDNVADHLAAFDLFLYPSRHEGLGSILLDALATGLPVVATAVGGIPEIIASDEHGVLVRPDDVDGLEAAVLRFQADLGLRERMARANRERARQFSAAAMTARYAALYRELAVELQLILAMP